jgi:hypothetical protein
VATTEKPTTTASDEQILQSAAPLFAPTQINEVFGCLPHTGPPKSLKDMDAGIAAAVRRHA